MAKNFGLKRSKSMCSLEDGFQDATAYGRDYRRGQSRTISDSSVEICVVVDSESEGDENRRLGDSGIADRSSIDGDMMHVLEQKMDRLNDMFQEQCRLLSTLKEELRSSRSAMQQAEAAQHDALTELVNKAVSQSGFKSLASMEASTGCDTNTRARSLLDAIELRQGFSVDKEIRDALASFLQSNELKEHMVATTAQSVKDAVGDCMSRDVSSLYLPILEHSHKRLVRTVTRTVEDAFVELEENSSILSKSVHKVTRSLRRSLERHQHVLAAAADPGQRLMTTLKYTVEEFLHKEMKEWRQKLLEVLTSAPQPAELPEPVLPLEYSPISPAPSTVPGRSIIDQLMMTAELTKQIQDGDANTAFERALSANDLSLVMAVCRAADNSPMQWKLQQNILLALIQQLSTDMLQDTMLKCRYLEDAIINLDPSNPQTRTHLPLVVGEVRKHLTKFRACYPSHAAGKRVALIIMAANNLLK